MSNKTQLQTNNINLDALITRVNAAKDIAASLPEAGSGGGGNVEVCTVTITLDPVAGPVPDAPTIYYIDISTSTIKSISTSNGTITVPVPSIIAIAGWSSFSQATGSCTQLFYGYGMAAYEIDGDCSLIYSP